MIENPKDLSNCGFDLLCKATNHRIKKTEVIILVLVNVQNRENHRKEVFLCE